MTLPGFSASAGLRARRHRYRPAGQLRPSAGSTLTGALRTNEPTDGPSGGGAGPVTGSTSIPIYGNYCGPGYGDESGATAPIDAVDAACRTHDLCYAASGYFNCG